MLGFSRLAYVCFFLAKLIIGLLLLLLFSVAAAILLPFPSISAATTAPVLNFRTAYSHVDEDAVGGGSRYLTFDACEVAQRYARGWLLVDVLSIIPFEAISSSS